MLREIEKGRRSEDTKNRRWFADDRMDLYVWFDDEGAIRKFQICYKHGDTESVVMWVPEIGITYHESPPALRYSAPILVTAEPFDLEGLRIEFAYRTKSLDEPFIDFVGDVLLNTDNVSDGELDWTQQLDVEEAFDGRDEWYVLAVGAAAPSELRSLDIYACPLSHQGRGLIGWSSRRDASNFMLNKQLAAGHLKVESMDRMALIACINREPNRPVMLLPQAAKDGAPLRD